MKARTNIEGGSYSALHLLHRAGQCADELFALNIGESELTPRQFEVLRAVASQSEPSQTTLVENTGIDRSTLADIVRRLVSRGLLVRKRTRHDARMYAVRLTASGEKALKTAQPAVKSTNDSILKALPNDERKEFLNALNRIIELVSTATNSRPER